MTSRERVLAAIGHRGPDRVPVDLGSTPSSGISAVAYGRLNKHLGLNGGRTRIYDVVQQLAEPDDEVLDFFGVDVIDIGRAYNEGPGDWRNAEAPDGSPAMYPAWFKPVRAADGSFGAYNADGRLVGRMPAGGAFFDQTQFPYQDGYPADYRGLPSAMGGVLWQALPHSPWDSAGKADFWSGLRRKALDLRASSDRALVIVCGCNLFEWGTFLRRMDNFLEDLVLEKARVEGLLDALMGIHLATLEKVCRAVGDVADIIRFGDDLGMDTGPLMSPETYRALFKPRHRRLCGFVRDNSRMHTFLHSCGSIHALIPDLIEAGYEIINPVQTSARDMEPERLKREFGPDLTFWGGGCDTRRVLNRASPDEVRKHVLEKLEILSPGGGFVFNPVHNILPEVPPGNIMAMFEAVNEFNGSGARYARSGVEQATHGSGMVEGGRPGPVRDVLHRVRGKDADGRGEGGPS